MQRFIPLLFYLWICVLSIYACGRTSPKVDQPPASPKDIIKDTVKHSKATEHDADFDHQAFVGAEEAKEYAQLTPEESKERLSKLLPAIDKNGDGIIDESELQAHLKFMQTRYVNNDVDRTWKNYSKLPWDIFRTSVYGPENQELAEEIKKLMERDRKRWKFADKLGDDELNREEYTCFLHPQTCEYMRDILVEEAIQDIDKNKDGFVDIEEYISDIFRPGTNPAEKEPEWVKTERDIFLLHRDKNKNGKLDPDEIREWIAPSGFDHALAEAKHLITLADDNKDGKLSTEEILKYYDVFVGSQATDWGEQLHKHDPSEL